MSGKRYPEEFKIEAVKQMLQQPHSQRHQADLRLTGQIIRGDSYSKTRQENIPSYVIYSCCWQYFVTMHAEQEQYHVCQRCEHMLREA
ncbi:hypothetical protein L8P27_16730 [Enterobacter asburiae]|uniref:hypothetical protein n=1 Tax=Enterobacter asburiae TaxID=61645 RepID=UPI0020030F45|nr:hypothetical protein [Enterobacter asburiae]MCK7229457.1 hypothetical protein [Enterobacter asburiae]